MKRFVAFLCMILCTFEANAQSYCVHDLAVPQPTIKLAYDEHLADYDYLHNAAITPASWLTDSRGNFIAAARNVLIESSDKRQRQQSFFWFLNPSKLSAPIESKEPLTSNLTQAIDDLGNLYFIGGHYNSDNSAWLTSLYWMNSTTPPKLVANQHSIPAPQAIFWSNVLKAFIITTFDSGKFGSVKPSAILMKDQKFSPFLNDGIRYVADLDSFHLTAFLSSNALYFASSPKAIQQVTVLNSGDDYNGWSGISDIGNGWLYIEGAQYSHALHIQKNADKWQADNIIRIVNEDTIGEQIFRYILGMRAEQMRRDHLDDIIAVKSSNYSSVLKRLFFLKEQKEFRDGKLISIGSGQYALKRYLGQSKSLGVAIFEGNNRQLYSYDGNAVKPIRNGILQEVRHGDASHGIVNELSDMRRTFFNTSSANYEIFQNGDSLEMKKLSIPSVDIGDMLFTRFISMPDRKEIAVMTRHYIYTLSDWRPIYSPPKGEGIDITGSDSLPAYMAPLSGIVFPTNGLVSLHLLSDCKL